MLRILSAAAMAAADGAAGAVAAGAAGAGAAGGVVSAALADTLRTANRKRARRPRGIPARAGIEELLECDFDFSPGRRGLRRPSAPAMIAVRAKPMKSPCSTTPGIGDKLSLSASGSRDGAERTVKNIVPAVGDERRGIAAQPHRSSQPELGEGALDMAPRRREAERNDLDRQRKGAELRDKLLRIRDHRHPPRRRGDDLFSQ